MRELMSLDDLLTEIKRNKKHLEEQGVTARIVELTRISEEPSFWTNSDTAGSTMRELADLKKEVSQWEDLELSVMVAAEGEASEEQLHTLNREFVRLETHMYLAGQYDLLSAIVSLHAGTGGVDAMDWTAMLLRMYGRFCEMQGWKVEIIHQTEGEEAGIKSVTFEVTGRYAYGMLKCEAGTHRLVRKSPFNAKGLRQTSFALVEVVPVIEDTSAVVVRDEDLRVDVFRASGAGGQHVNKTESAVRITHIPSGIVVSCQSERSQHQNKEHAMKILRARLLVRLHEERDATLKAEKGETGLATWGNQIRSYVMQPYQLVKDHRTDEETSQVTDVLDGHIEDFIDAMLRKKDI
ncbi:MAG: peptide chain release factor 2 [Patescibacteria group bacterium]